MEKWKQISVKPTQTLFDTMRVIDEGAMQFALVLNDDGKLCGTVTDGDIRRGILRGEGLDVAIHTVMNTTPFSAPSGQSVTVYKQLMKLNQLKQLPIIDEQHHVLDVLFLDNLEPTLKSNKVVLMLGGLGTRLRPLTNDIPKPMLPVGEKPIVETIIEGFKQYGYYNFIFCVNYKKEVIQDYFQDGSAFGITVEYIEEHKRMGTAGALSLIENQPTEPFFVMNGDLLTKINYDQLMQFHKQQQAIGTMCVREYEYQVPYGVIETEGTSLKSIQEKPIHRSFINAGVYVLSPEAFNYIPNNTFYDMPTLFEQMKLQQKKAAVFPIHEYWLDIGQKDEYYLANREIKETFI